MIGSEEAKMTGDDRNFADSGELLQRGTAKSWL
jgi:hypothetical protein